MEYEQAEVMNQQLKQYMEHAKLSLGQLRTIIEALRNDPNLIQLVNEVKIEGFKDEESYTDQEDYERGYCNCHQMQYPCKCRKCDALKAEAYKDFALFKNSIGDVNRTLEVAEEELEDAYHYFVDAIKYLAWADCCSKRNYCECYCKYTAE